MRARKGMTLVELVVSVTILSIIAAATAGLLQTSVDILAFSRDYSRVQREGLRIMALLQREVRGTSHVFSPHGGAPDGAYLVISENRNEDNDSYGGLAEFPRFDEDSSGDMNNDNKSGLVFLSDLLDDLLGGLTGGLLGGLLSNSKDDDGDGDVDEDPKNGIDDDGDGAIDEDWPADNTGDGEPGLPRIDEDLDGAVDEGDARDDDEDGQIDEDWLNPVIYFYEEDTGTLKRQAQGENSPTVIASGIADFRVRYAGGASGYPTLRVELRFEAPDGGEVLFDEYMTPRNLLQRDGLRVK